MPHSFWETIAETPWWFYVFFIFFIYVSLQARKAHTVSYTVLFAIPFFLLVFCTLLILAIYKITFSEIKMWFISLLLGVLLGWVQFWALKIKAVKNEKKLYIPATWSLLIISILLFAALSFYGSKISFDVQILLEPAYTPVLISLYGLFTGIFFGRFLYALRTQKKGPFLD